ncbi:hypothetical protein QO034_05625 [Sedimentitalea sp. JM2-8]|uniref:Uncharacterized protein n=1 Tax=Sedimentitalea xiamensis TaxID=3050037 RepID=A0ABT7FBU4_9RHOB|nr:hypothetical protein [Sedimentitalea xiamensis]MDK3072582.1 hypothetical protein [Sedimentitalea xiamensis]
MRLTSSIAAAAIGPSAAWAIAEDLSFANFMPPGRLHVEDAFHPFADKVAEKTGAK